MQFVQIYKIRLQLCCFASVKCMSRLARGTCLRFRRDLEKPKAIREFSQQHHTQNLFTRYEWKIV